MDLELPPEMPNGIGGDDDDEEEEEDDGDRDDLDDSYDLTGGFAKEGTLQAPAASQIRLLSF